MADYNYIETTGLIVPQTSDLLAEVQGEYQAAFGSDLIVDPSTPQGVLITAEALARSNFLNNNAAIANEINPNYAGGVFLDAIMALTGIQRNGQTQTLVTNVTLSGVPGTVIPMGAYATTTAGDLFQLVNQVTIPSGGSTLGTFTSVAYGAIPCANESLTAITTGVIGWESVTNDQSGTPASVTTLGTITQSDPSGRAYRGNTLGFQGLALPVAITSALYAVPDVTSLSFLENYNSAPMGMIVPVASGTTESATVWAMSTTAGTGTNGNIIVGTDAINFTENVQTVPAITPWPQAAYTTTGNITLSGDGTQSGGDWPSTIAAGTIILVKNQTSAAQNGVYLSASGAWTRHPYNTTAAQILPSNQGISMIANSIYACVAGGSQVNIASALLENKSSGCAWNGGTTVPIVEPASGQTYNVTYDTPVEIGILIEVTCSGVTEAQVEQAILDYQAGTVTDPAGNPSNLIGFQVGQDVSPFELAAAIAIENPGAYVSNVQIAVDVMSPSFSTSPIGIGLNRQAYTQLSFITVNIV